jgi:hypothetical protein
MPYEAFRELEHKPVDPAGGAVRGGRCLSRLRVVGTSDAFFEPRFPYPASASVAGKFAAGGPFISIAARSGAPREIAGAGAEQPPAVELPSGSAPSSLAWRRPCWGRVARQLDIRINDRIEPTHGVDVGGTAHEHQQLWTVVGLLEATGTPDRRSGPDQPGFLLSRRPIIGVGRSRDRQACHFGVVLFPKPGCTRRCSWGS